MGRWTRMGIESFRAGNRAQAERFFRYALMEDPNDIRSLLWLVEIATDDEEKKRCLEEVLRIDPRHALAYAALRDVQERLAASSHGVVAPATGPRLASQDVHSQPPFVLALNQRLANEPVSVPVAAPAVPPPPADAMSMRWLRRGLIIIVTVSLTAATIAVLVGH